MLSKVEIEKAKEDIKALRIRCLSVDYGNSLSQTNLKNIDILLQYIDHLEKRIEKQEKIINEMAIQISGLAIFDIEKDEPIILKSEEEVKQYFEEKVEEK